MSEVRSCRCFCRRSDISLDSPWIICDVVVVSDHRDMALVGADAGRSRSHRLSSEPDADDPVHSKVQLPSHASVDADGNAVAHQSPDPSSCRKRSLG